MLFPALAGVIPTSDANAAEKSTFPRTRGGDPFTPVGELAVGTFSPHSRG